MGVPKFYRWISERYPCLSEVVKEYQIPEFDNLYLDMNGIIHTCSHPEDDNPHFRITEEKIFQDIFHYIEVLFRMIKPRKVFFMAVDGVAPRAKMNQQRGRRFRSAREAENLVKKALEKGEVLPTEARFDSNCITPGTEFMAKLDEQLRYFVVKKMSTDRLWQGVRVFLSGHKTPGEGEHKVMDFIRHEKAQSDFDPNTRHCLYGLDADLIMLGLTTHEPHFSLLREEVRFGKQATKRATTAEETTFHLLHISLLREYIDFEFSSLKGKVPFDYDLERIIDDWVLMGFLVGNDFIPHLPDLHIHHDALPLLWKTYKKVLPTLNGYMNDGGHLQLENFECFMRCLSKYDVDTFSEKHADIQWLQSRKKTPKTNKPDALGSEETGIPTANEFMSLRDEDSGDDDYSTSLQSDMESLAQVYDFSDEEKDDEYEEEKLEQDSQFYKEFSKFKASYYKEKLHYTNVSSEVLREQAFEYVKAIQWILHYYFNGVPSWSWFYPFHYAPYLSDVRDFSKIKLEYDFARPFLPFQQLMAVLPAASKNLIPQPFQTLMLSESSQVKDFYPVDFETDLNGKQQDWEAVVLIPFIDEDRLLRAMRPLEAKLTDEEKGRNIHGPHILFTHSPKPQGTFTSTVFPDLINHNAIITEVQMEQFWMDVNLLRKGLCAGVKQDIYFPGFPTLKHIPHSAKLKKAGVKVFQHISRGENMVMTVHNTKPCDHEQLAHDLIGRSIHVQWPHLIEAKVNAISDGETRFYGEEAQSPKSKSTKEMRPVIQCEDLDKDAASIWHKEAAGIKDSYIFRRGVDIGDTLILLYASPLTGRKYVCGSNGQVTLQKQWANSSLPYVLQCAVKDLTAKEPCYKHFSSLDELFSVDSEVFMLGQPHYGAMGKVLSVDTKNDGRVRVDFTILEQPDPARFNQLRQNMSGEYYPGYSMARRIGITNYVLSRITGSVFITVGSQDRAKEEGKGGNKRINVGLNLKFNKTNMEVPGYTKKANDEWLYGIQLQALVEDYYENFPELFEFISASSNESTYFEEDIFEGTDHTASDVTKYLKKIPTASIQPVPHGSDVLDDFSVAQIEAEVAKVKEHNSKKKKHIKMQVRPHLLLRPLEAQLNLVPDPTTTYALFDRIINVRDGFSVPLGLTGTVIGITNSEKEQDVLYDVVFDEEFLGGLTLRCSPLKGYRMPKTAMINISHGERKAQGRVLQSNKPTAVVKPQTTPGRSYAKAASHYDNLRGNQDGYSPRQQQQYQGQRYSDNNYGSRQNQGHQQHDGYQGNRQQAWQQQQQQQVPTQIFKNQAYSNHRGDPSRNVPQPGPQNEFADMWSQLQGAYNAGDPNLQSAPQQKPGKSRQQQTSKQGTTPGSAPSAFSLQDAAIALQGSQFSRGPQVNDTTSAPKSKQNHANQALKNKQDSTQNQDPHDPTGGQKIDLDALFSAPAMFGGQSKKDKQASKGRKNKKDGESQGKLLDGASAQNQPELALDPFNSANEFDSIFSALNLSDKQKEKEAAKDVGESTAALCQMLKIKPTESKASSSEPSADNSAPPPSTPSYGKQLSVQELFGEAKQHQKEKVVKSPKAVKSPGKGGPKLSTVDNLDAWCKTVGLATPLYDYQVLAGNKQRAVVKLANGQVFQGSVSNSATQAADSAAGVALLHQNMTPGMRGPSLGLGNLPQQQQQQQNGSHRLSTSPNSAFTPVRQNLALPMGSRPPFSNWGQVPPFPPPPPHFGPPPTHQQQLRYPQPRHPGQRPQGHRPPQGPYPNPPHFPPQGHDFPPPPFQASRDRSPRQPRSNPQTQQQHQGRGHQSGRGHKDHRDTARKPGREDNVNRNETDAQKKSNPFIPMQVLRQQKTPQKDSKRPDAQSQGDQSSSQVASEPEILVSCDLPAVSLDIPQVSHYQTTTMPGAAEVMSQNVMSVQFQDTPPDTKQNTPARGTETTPGKARTGKRPKSRLAANFGGNK